MTTAEPFRIVVEPDGDAWHAYCPALEKYGAATWGETRNEALENIRQVIEIVVTDLAEAWSALSLKAATTSVTPMHHGQAVRLTRLVRRRADRI